MQDFGLIVLSVIVAILLLKTNVLAQILTSTVEIEFLGSLIAGMFFTSIFTTAPAIVALGEIAQVNGIVTTALWGAAGAVVGDLLIFRFVRDRFSVHLVELAKQNGTGRRIAALLKFRLFHWMTFVAGGLIIASPFPDELGISLLGFSKMPLSYFIPLSYTFNFLGILAIGTIAQAVAS